MSQIKKLAGQTAYYGISSILGRVLNFLLLPIWTDRLIDAEYGVVSYIYASVALCLIIYTYGMETAFFRFTSKGEGKDVFNSAATSILLTSALISGFLFIQSSGVASFLGKGVLPEYVEYLAVILFIDAVVAIPFAKLRLEEKALKFAVIRTSVITVTILLNLLFLVVFPDILDGKYLSGLENAVSKIYDPKENISYIFISNLAANLLYIPLLFRELFSIRLNINWPLFKKMLVYALPIFLMGLGGMFNEQGYSLILKNIPIDPEIASSSEAALGKFSSVFKLSVIMMLGIQAFRYAAEPFFFSHADNRQAPELFAKVMHYFVSFNVVILVGVALNIELISDIFLRRPEYKEALYVLPILLLAKLFYGVYVNLSVWFKIKDKTIYGAYFAIIGAIITLVGNLFLIPLIGYYGSAITSLVCYAAMSILCWQQGRKYFKVPYSFGPLFVYLIIALLLVYVSGLLSIENQWLRYGYNLLLSGLFLLFMFYKEGRHINYKTTRGND